MCYSSQNKGGKKYLCMKKRKKMHIPDHARADSYPPSFFALLRAVSSEIYPELFVRGSIQI